MIMLVCDGSKLELDEVVAKGLKLPENAMGEDPRGNITCHLPDITANVIMLVCDGSKLELDEVVAKGLKLPENAMGEDPRGNITCHLPDITANVMAMVIDYCKNPKAHIDKNIGPVFLFDLIQAAHYFEIKTLMDLTCQTLVSMVKMKSVREIREEFTNQKYEPSKRAQSSTERIKRLHERETFIKPSTSVYVQRSRCVTAALSSIDRRKSRFDVSAVNLLKNYKSKKDLMAATYSLSFSLERARELGDRLQYNHIVLLVGILEEQESQKQCTSADSHLKVHVLEILSRVSSTALKDAMTEARFQLLLKIIRDSDYAVAHRAVVTLTNIVKVLPEVIVTVVANGALTCVNTAVLKYRGLDMMDGVAMFLITVCRTADLSHHVEVAVGTLLDLLEAPLFAEKACYALQYLTYGKELRIYAAMSRKLIKNLIEFIKKPLYCSCEFPGYALAVVGNIARWGSSVQIEILTSECRILEELGSIINAHGKKIQKEACQIISNIAATKEGSLREIHTARLTDPLCSLLEKDEADVKMEGVWAIYNSIYGSKFDPSIALSPR